uniref:bifunctional aminoglycoside phosphotransferase/ATP-binding protein n=1 Tax=Cupriavidus yeoncheonensis TaxID=1462994 RepID=UPI003F497A8E
MDDAAMTAALARPDAYPFPVDDVSVIETHISRVFLAGDFAYKVRKPVRFDFVDFSTAQARRDDCETELRLNRRLAPELYLDVVPIVASGAGGTAQMEGNGAPVEYAVKMRRFAQRDLLIEMLRENRLHAAHVDALALRIAEFHRGQPSARVEDGFGTPARINAILAECLGGIERLGENPGMAREVSKLVRSRATALAGAVQSRLRHGCVRECHGDLHLGNIVLVDEKPTPFDCLEFDPALRWIDTISDIAFPFMDLLHHGRQDLAYRLLNVYLEHSGDYAGLKLLPFYAAMRALVRARVMLERLRQSEHVTGASMSATRLECRNLLTLAWRLVVRRPAALVVMHGLSGSGKSTVAAALAEAAAMVRVRSDVERKRLHHGMRPADGRYSRKESDRTYERLRAICRVGCGAGLPMIADATFLSSRQRDRFMALAHRLCVPFFIVQCEAPVETLKARIKARAQACLDASEADCATLAWQLQVQEPLTDLQRACVVPAHLFDPNSTPEHAR